MSYLSAASLDDLDKRLELARRVLRMENADAFLTEMGDRERYNANLLFGYVRSFVRLAYLGDVSIAARELETTRQTIGRHIMELENLLECTLFEAVGANSRMTEWGVLWLPRAEEIFDTCSALFSKKDKRNTEYRSTQLPLRMLLRDSSISKRLSAFAGAWMLGDKSLSCERMAQFHDHWITYERKKGTWCARSVGANSALSQFYGQDLATNSAGATIQQMISGTELRDEISFLLDSIYTRGGIHFSEVACRLIKPGTTEPITVLYQRVLVELSDENERPVVGSVIELMNLAQEDQAFQRHA